MQLGWFASPSLLTGQSDAIIVADQRRTGRSGEHFGSGWSSGKSLLGRVMEEGERAGGNVLQHGRAPLWGRESGARGGRLEGKGLLRTNQPQVSGKVRCSCGAAEAQSGTSCPLIKARWETEAGLGGGGSLLGSAGSSFDPGSSRTYFGVEKGLEFFG